MLIEIPQVLAKEQIEEFVDELSAAQWADGRGSAGYLSAAVKSNAQLALGGTEPMTEGSMELLFGTLVASIRKKRAKYENLQAEADRANAEAHCACEDLRQEVNESRRILAELTGEDTSLLQ